MDPEVAHDRMMYFMQKYSHYLPKRFNEDFVLGGLGGQRLKSPFGLAAGFDKNAEALEFLSRLPFGFLEIGTVTLSPQEGNEKPRLFRMPHEESLRNRMGFNNLGAEQVLANINSYQERSVPIGINLGKNKSTPNEFAHNDYSLLYKKLSPVADYLVINVSSPNTPHLRDLLKESGLRDIFMAVKKERDQYPKPLYVKISPDMTFQEIDHVILLVKEFALSGIIATNTSIMKEKGEGGVSGKLIYQKAKSIRSFLLQRLKETPTIELIGVGGFSSFEEMNDYWREGGRLIQLYTSFIYQGPTLLFQLESTLSDRCKKVGAKTFDDYLLFLRE